MSVSNPTFGGACRLSFFTGLTRRRTLVSWRGRSDEGAEAAHGVGEHDSMTGTKRSDCLAWSVPAGGSDSFPLDVRSHCTGTWSG